MRTPNGYRLAAVFAAAALATLPAAAQQAGSATAGWPRTSPAAQNLAAAPLEQLVMRARNGDFGNTDRLVVVRNGSLVLDERFDRDYRALSRGKTSPLGCGIDACADSSDVDAYNYLHPDVHPWWRGRDVHTLQSVTKSVTATLFGVAIARGEIPDLDAPLLSFFGAYDLTAVDERLRGATLRDLLTMRTGIEWHETDRPLDETNTTLQLERSDDWIRFTLAQPMDAAPGAKWVYNSGGSQLMAEVIRSATGEHVDRYAEDFFFGPLGIRDYHWKKTPTGHPDTEGGLYLEALDLAKIGQLYLNDGTWDGRRILPEGWAREATMRHVDRINDTANAPGYGYQWWRYDRRGTDVWAGNGFGGQFLVVIPAHGIVGVVNSWNVFGDRVQGILVPFIDALLTAAGVPAASG
jgi:CubicO group peptidase (beta-lactamase class C family)